MTTMDNNSIMQRKWEILDGIIDDIQMKKTSNISFMQAYSIIYDLMLEHRCVAGLYRCLEQVVKEHVVNRVRNDIKKSYNYNFLQNLYKAWTDHQTAMSMINSFTGFLDKIFIKRNNYSNLYDLGLTIFRDEIIKYEPITKCLRETMLELIMRERNKEVIDGTIIKNVVEMLVTLGMNSLSLYEEIFETPFINQSTKYYRKTSRNCIEAGYSAVQYFKNAEHRKHEEVERVKNYLNISTKDKIEEVILTEMIMNHIYTVYEMMNELLHEPHIKVSDLASLYRVLTAGSCSHLIIPALVLNHSEMRKGILKSFDDSFFDALDSAWQDHLMAMDGLKRLGLYLGKQYLEINNLQEVQTLGPGIFRDEVVRYRPIREHLKKTFLKLIMKERNGEVIDRVAIKKATLMLVQLGSNSLHIYDEIFGEPFLSDSECYYKKLSRECLEKDSSSEYIRQVEAQINEEKQRVHSYLDVSTLSRIEKIIQTEMIENHLLTIVQRNSGVAHMLVNQNISDLALMYQLFSPIPHGISTIFDSISNYIQKEGEALVKEQKQDKISFIHKILDLKDKLENVLHQSFKSNNDFSKLITTGIEDILHLNDKSPEYLSMFIDNMLRIGFRRMTDNEIGEFSDKILDIYRLLKEKDVFVKYYKQHLAKRLLFNKSICEHYECDFISNLKNKCSATFTEQLEGMLKDMNVSRDGMREFEKHVTSSNIKLYEMDFNVTVLSSCYWLVVWPKSQCSLPYIPQVAFDTFMAFYLDKHYGRKFTLLPACGSANMNAYFYQSIKERCGDAITSILDLHVEPRKYNLEVSTFQMCVLMLFNKKGSYSYQEIASETFIPEDDLKRTVQSLTTGDQKLLIKSPQTKEIQPSDTFRINNSFSYSCHRIKLRQVVAAEEIERGNKITGKKVEHDRRVAIDAAIIRIMKVQKEMTHTLLVAEVKTQLKARFLPSPVLIKKRIEQLIYNDYLDRSKENRNIYKYIL